MINPHFLLEELTMKNMTIVENILKTYRFQFLRYQVAIKNNPKSTVLKDVSASESIIKKQILKMSDIFISHHMEYLIHII